MVRDRPSSYAPQFTSGERDPWDPYSVRPMRRADEERRGSSAGAVVAKELDGRREKGSAFFNRNDADRTAAQTKDEVVIIFLPLERNKKCQYLLVDFSRVWISVGNDVKGAKESMPDASASEVLHTCSPGKEIDGTGSPILDRVTLGKPGTKKSFADILRG